MSKQFSREGSKYDIEDIETILLSKGYPETLFSDLEQHRPNQNEGRANCPFCGDTAGHFYYSKEKPVWCCFKCGAKGNWFTYLQDRRRLEFKEALLELAGAAGVHVSECDQQKYETYVRKTSLLDAAQDIFVKALKSSAGKDVREYLLRRGYSQEDIDGMGLGAYTSRKQLVSNLRKAGFSYEEIKGSGLLAGRNDKTGEFYDLATYYRLAIPLQDARGRTSGISFRLLADGEDLDKLEDEGFPKYRYSAGYSQSQGLTGLSRAISSKRKILVEGVLDAHYVNFRAEKAGFKEPIVALGTNRISEDQIQALEATGTEEVILALDSDPRGLEGTAEIIDRLRLRNAPMRLYVAPLADYADGSEDKVDPDSLVRSKGIEAFLEACRHAESWSRWYAYWTAVSTAEEVDIASDRGRDVLLGKLSTVYAGIDDRHERISFLEPLADLRITDRDLEEKSQDLRQSRAEERTISRLELLKRQLETVSLQDPDSGQFSTKELESLLTHSLNDLRIQQVKAPEPYMFQDLMADVLNTPDGLRIGYQALDSAVRIPQGALTIIAARPGQGKTTFQLNLLVKLVKAYPQRRFYFFSYEESRKALAIKLIMILAGEVIEANTNYGAYVNYLREKRGQNALIEKAIQEYKDLTQSGRLWLLDTRARTDELCRTISYLDQTGETGGVFIDYIQKILPENPQSVQYLNIKEVSGQILDTAVNLDIPIILGAQLGRPEKGASDKAIRLDNLREGGDIEQDANLVLGLHCPAVEAMEESDHDAKEEQTVDLIVKILKNRAGISGKKTTLRFNRPVLTITDIDKKGGVDSLL